MWPWWGWVPGHHPTSLSSLGEEAQAAHLTARGVPQATWASQPALLSPLPQPQWRPRAEWPRALREAEKALGPQGPVMTMAGSGPSYSTGQGGVQTEAVLRGCSEGAAGSGGHSVSTPLSSKHLSLGLCPSAVAPADLMCSPNATRGVLGPFLTQSFQVTKPLPTHVLIGLSQECLSQTWRSHSRAMVAQGTLHCCGVRFLRRRALPDRGRAGNRLGATDRAPR